MAQVHRLKWSKRGPAAISENSFGLEFDVREPEAVVDDDGVAVVDICGPLLQYGGFFFDGYDSILCRAACAFTSSAKTVILKINSPGGDVYGNLECARAIRAMADESGKALITYVDGQAASAAYALACAADRIVTPATGCVGSIGVVDMIASVTRQDEAMGIDVAVITSGKRKADGNPHVPLTEAAQAVRQAHVDELAGILFAWVGERRGLSVEAIAGYEAGIFTGASGVKAGLADEVADFLALRENLSHGTNTATAQRVPGASRETMSSPKSSKYTDAMAALAALAEEGDEDAKKAMKKMLAPKKDSDAPASSAPPADSSAPPKGEDESASAQAAAPVPAGEVAMMADLAAVKNELAAMKEKEERSTLLASRPDLMGDAKFAAWLNKASIETVREAVKNVPEVKALAPSAEPTPTRGAGQGGPAGLTPAQSDALKIRMGLAPTPIANVTRGPHAQVVFGGDPEQVAVAIANRPDLSQAERGSK